MKLDIQLFGGRGASSSNVGGGRSFDGTVQLQGYGRADAYNAENIKKGDILLWNYGYTSKVKNVESTPSGKSVKITTTDSRSGNEYTNTYRKNRLLAVTKTEAKTEREATIKSLSGRLRV